MLSFVSDREMFANSVNKQTGLSVFSIQPNGNSVFFYLGYMFNLKGLNHPGKKSICGASKIVQQAGCMSATRPAPVQFPGHLWSGTNQAGLNKSG